MNDLCANNVMDDGEDCLPGSGPCCKNCKFAAKGIKKTILFHFSHFFNKVPCVERRKSKLFVIKKTCVVATALIVLTHFSTKVKT